MQIKNIYLNLTSYFVFCIEHSKIIKMRYFKSILIFLILNSFISFPIVGETVIDDTPKSLSFDSQFDLEKIQRSSANVNIKAVLVICDHYITPENNRIAQSLRVDLGTVNQLLDILEKRKIATVEKILLQGTKATMANILQTMKSLQSGPNDVILYYFSGHGLMEKGKTYMLTADEKYLGRAEVEGIIKSKSARLKMLITDACSNDVDGLTASRSITKPNQQIEAGLFDETYRDLFHGYQGMMHLSASTEGELAWSNNQFGGFFTYHFFKEGLVKKPINDWTQIFANARDKTSQMFMRMPAEQRSELAKQGVTNQTAKAFSMPTSRKTTNNNTSSNNQGNNNPPIQNQAPPAGQINIYNYTGNNVNFATDYNLPNKTWTPSNVQQMALYASRYTTIPFALATVSYNYQGQDYYFELENGDFFFAYDENRILQLFYKDADINETNFNSVSITDFNTLFLGHWAWEDGKTGTTMLTSFDENYFVDTNPEDDSADGGTWFTRKEAIDGDDYNFVTFVYDADGIQLMLDYSIMYDLEYPDQVQLIFIAAYADNEMIPYEDAEEFLEPSLMLYKISE